jgi:hypothetical protein
MIGILLCKLKACATEKWDRKGDNDVYGLYFQSGRNMCAGDTDAERNDDAVRVIVIVVVPLDNR